MEHLTNIFCTSFYTEKTILEIRSNSLCIKELPSDKSFNEILVYIHDDKNNIYKKEFLSRIKSKYAEYILPNLSLGRYYLSIYRKSMNGDNMYYSYMGGVDIPIFNEHGCYHFVGSMILQSNEQFILKIKTDRQSLETYTKPSYYIQSYDAEIKEKAKEITRFSHNDYHKVLAIHNWVARTLYYDYDALEGDAYKSMHISATNTLSTGKSVCQGYTELAIAMMRAVGIPAIGVICYAIDSNTQGGWNNPMCLSETNHIIAIAYVEGRWIIMDSTWDSSNRFEDKEYIQVSSNGIFTKHFDMSLPFVSNTHRFGEIFI